MNGFSEYQDALGEQFGAQRMCEVIRRRRHLTCREIVERIYESVLEFSAGSPQLDDLTALIVKKTGR